MGSLDVSLLLPSSYSATDYRNTIYNRIRRELFSIACRGSFPMLSALEEGVVWSRVRFTLDEIYNLEMPPLPGANARNTFSGLIEDVTIRGVHPKDLEEIREAKEKVLLTNKIDGPLIAEKFYWRSAPVLLEADGLVAMIILMKEDRSRVSRVEIPPFYYGDQTIQHRV